MEVFPSPLWFILIQVSDQSPAKIWVPENSSFIHLFFLSFNAQSRVTFLLDTVT